MDKKFYLDVPNNVFNFLQTLQKDSIYRYYPTSVETIGVLVKEHSTIA